MELKVGSAVETLDGDCDCDENDNPRSTPPGSVGRVVDVDPAGYYHVIYPNGVWVILTDEELPRYKIL